MSDKKTASKPVAKTTAPAAKKEFAKEKGEHPQPSKFGKPQGSEKRGFGQDSAPKNEGRTKTSAFSSFSTFSRYDDSKGYQNNRGKGGEREGGRDNRGEKREGDKIERVQKGSEWYESSDFCRTNLKTGEVKWKEEFWSNRPPRTTMVEVTNGSKGDNRFHVPSTWNFNGYKLLEITNSEGTKRMFVELPENEKVKSKVI